MKTLERQVAILHALADAPPEGTSLRQIARDTGLAPSSTHRLLTGLVDVHFVVQNAETEKYRLGYGVLRLAGAILGQSTPGDLVTPYLADITRSSGLYSFAAAWTGTAAVCIATREPGDTGSFYVRIGRVLPIHATAAAKALVYRFSKARLRRLAERSLATRFTQHTLSSLDALLDDLRRGSDLGYWESNQELENGVYAVAAPVLGPDDEPVMSLTVLGAQPTRDDDRDRLIAVVRDAADRATRDIGRILASWASRSDDA